MNRKPAVRREPTARELIARYFPSHLNHGAIQTSDEGGARKFRCFCTLPLIVTQEQIKAWHP